MERNNVITTLEVLRTNCSKHSRDYQALDYAISSLKTDEAYQIIYEGGEMFTKADIVAMLTDIQTEIEELDLKDSVPDYQKGADETREYIANLLQQKIDSLKGGEDATVNYRED